MGKLKESEEAIEIFNKLEKQAAEIDKSRRQSMRARSGLEHFAED